MASRRVKMICRRQNKQRSLKMPFPALIVLLALATGIASGAVSAHGVDLAKLHGGQAVYNVNK
jgi:hypothetical protein